MLVLVVVLVIEAPVFDYDDEDDDEDDMRIASSTKPGTLEALPRSSLMHPGPLQR